MKFAIVIVLLFTITANAQKASPSADSAKTVAVQKQLAATDTVAALHKLFKARRKGGMIMTTSAIAGNLFLTSLALPENNSSKSYSKIDSDVSVLFNGFAAAIITLIGIHKLIDYSAKREAKVIAKFQEHQPLPHYVRRHLKIHFVN